MAVRPRKNSTKRSLHLGAIVCAAGLTFALSGCNNAGQGAFSGAAIGTLGGLSLGALSGNAGEGAIIGLVSGAIAGGVIGDQNARRSRYAPGSYPGAHGHDRLPDATMPQYYDPRYDGPESEQQSRTNRETDSARHNSSGAYSEFAPNYGDFPPAEVDETYDDESFVPDDPADADVEENVIPFYSGPTLYDYDGVLDLKSRSYSYLDTYDDANYYDGDSHNSLATYASYSPSWSIRIGLSGYYGWCGTCNAWHHNRYSYRCGYRARYYSYYDNYWGSHSSCYASHRNGYYRYSPAYYGSSYSYYGHRPRYSLHIGYSDNNYWWAGHSGYSYKGHYGYYNYSGRHGGNKSSYDHNDNRWRATNDSKYHPAGVKKKYRNDPNRLRRERRDDRDHGGSKASNHVYASSSHTPKRTGDHANDDRRRRNQVKSRDTNHKRANRSSDRRRTNSDHAKQKDRRAGSGTHASADKQERSQRRASVDRRSGRSNTTGHSRSARATGHDRKSANRRSDRSSSSTSKRSSRRSSDRAGGHSSKKSSAGKSSNRRQQTKSRGSSRSKGHTSKRSSGKSSRRGSGHSSRRGSSKGGHGKSGKHD